MDLDLDPVRTTGRAPAPVMGEVVRELTSADIALLDQPRGSKPCSIKRLRDNHHSIARLIASGKPNNEVALITGYSESRISILKSDPAFEELVAHYKSLNDEANAELIIDGAAKLQAVRNDAIEELHDRLSDTPETIPTETLMDIVKLTSDRTGLGPASKSTNVNVNVDLATRIAAGRRRVAQFGGQPPTKVVEVLPPPALAQGGRK